MKKIIGAITCLLVFCMAGNGWAKILYVKTDGLDTNSGLSWQQAVQTVQTAVGLADPDDQIWVAGGTYALSTQIVVDKALGIYGGFAGTETELSQRNVQINVTTVDGQDSINCFTVTADATIDGLSITKGKGVIDDDYFLRGGAIYHPSANLTLTNCSFFENQYADFGGAIFSESHGSLIIAECNFNDNRVYHEGGAIRNKNATLSIVNSTFTHNMVNLGGAGGGINSSGGSLSVSGCTFTSNRGDWWGGAIIAANCTVTDSTFIDNSATGAGAISAGGMYANISSCTFIQNRAGYYGGGAMIIRENADISKCKFIDNWSSGDEDDRGGGYGGGAILIPSGQPVISNCLFSGNECETFGGAIANGNKGWDNLSNPVITNCTFHGNRALLGGAIFSNDLAAPTISNSIIWGNLISNDPQIYGGTPTVSYSDIDQDDYEGIDGNIRQDPLFVSPGYWDDNGTPDSKYDDIWVNGDYHLQAESPCIDTGTSANAPDDDFDGDARPQYLGYDMGVDEYLDCTLDAKFQETTLDNGIEYYTDRIYTLTDVPAGYVGMDMIKTPNDDRELETANGYLTFELSASTTVYVAYDSRAESLPDWMGSFSDTGDRVYTSLGTQPFLAIYSKSYAAGECVNLGANKAPGFSGETVNNFIVFYEGPPECKADFNSDGNVDESDLGLFSSAVGTSNCTLAPDLCDCDIDGDDNDIDGVDLAILTEELGRTDCP